MSEARPVPRERPGSPMPGGSMRNVVMSGARRAGRAGVGRVSVGRRGEEGRACVGLRGRVLVSHRNPR